jgi:hypothetical protein
MVNTIPMLMSGQSGDVKFMSDTLRFPRRMENAR